MISHSVHVIASSKAFTVNATAANGTWSRVQNHAGNGQTDVVAANVPGMRLHLKRRIETFPLDPGDYDV